MFGEYVKAEHTHKDIVNMYNIDAINVSISMTKRIRDLVKSCGRATNAASKMHLFGSALFG